MHNNVLFVNRDKSVIREFVEAMREYDFEIDTADSGLEAAALLKKKQYKVVITGMSLSTYDGTKLIAYLNKSCPETVCIVYTTRVDLAQLKLLVNERDVFRIFLKPANYRGDFYDAIKDGFAYYDVKTAEKQQRELMEQKHNNAVMNLAQVQQISIQRQREKEDLGRFLLPLVEMTVRQFGPEIGREGQERLLCFEREILSYGLEKNTKPCASLSEMEQRLQREFGTGENGRKITIETIGIRQDLELGFYENSYLVTWLLLKRIGMFSDTYEVKIEIRSLSKSKAALTVTAILPEGTWQKIQQDELFQIFSNVTRSVIENVAINTVRSTEENQVQYRMEIKAGGYGLKNLELNGGHWQGL